MLHKLSETVTLGSWSACFSFSSGSVFDGVRHIWEAFSSWLNQVNAVDRVAHSGGRVMVGPRLYYGQKKKFRCILLMAFRMQKYTVRRSWDIMLQQDNQQPHVFYVVFLKKELNKIPENWTHASGCNRLLGFFVARWTGAFHKTNGSIRKKQTSH